MRILIAFILFGLFMTKNYESSDSTIIWGDSVNLKFEDFRGLPDRDTIGAVTCYGITKHIYTKEDSLFIVLTCVFEKDKSWIKYRDTSLLNHEYFHFCLTEVYARMMRKAIANMRFSENNFISKIDSLYNLYNDNLDKEQDLYDVQTDYSRDDKNQGFWNNKIKQQIQSYKAFKDTITSKLFIED